jgi:DNA polymerase-3 subunit gamma/tau
MSYQVIARKWRPQKFDDVVGQQAVTRTLRNALASGRLAQSFVFAGPRGVGKTTTARILARALSCDRGPTADPCGECDACKEIADGRDMDVLEIDAATHTQVENIREIIVSNLAIAPVRNRYKVFIIDEVHQLSSHSFNALLKSIEEPPPHVVFMMATTELEKIPETVLSRSQVYELRPIGTGAIAAKLRQIVDEEGIAVGQESLQLIARAAEGSMRDAQSKLDQVIAFTGGTIAAEDVATVLGLVGRDLLLDTLDAVASEDAAASFALVARAMEMGYDLRAVCRELSRVVRDLLVVSVDASRLADPEIAGEGEADRLKSLVARFSREDLLRAFDLLTKAEADIRAAAQPRYHLEMALLRWMHLRKLVPIEDLIASAGAAGAERAAPRLADAGRPMPRPAPAASAPPQRVAPAPAPKIAAPPQAVEPRTPPAPSDPSGFKEALLAQIKSGKPVFYNMVVAQAQTIEVAADRVTFTLAPSQRALGTTFEQHRGWLESIAQQIAGRRMTASCVVAAPADAAPPAAGTAAADKKSALRQQALADAGVQTMLEIFPAEIRDVEEM